MWASERRRALISCTGALVIALAAAGCGEEGGDGEIPKDTSDEMLSLVGEIEQATADEECETAESSTTSLMQEVQTLPGGQTKSTLVEMVENLDRNLENECTETGTTDEDVETKPETTDTVETETTPVAPTTSTTTTTSVPEEDDTDEPAPPEEQPPGNGGGGSQNQGPPAVPPGQSGTGDGGIGAEDRGPG
jgi:hypothetical protein